MIFPPQGVNCVSESVSAFAEPVFQAHLIGYFSKRRCKPAKFQNKLFCYRIKKYQQGPLCLRVLLGVSLSSGSGFLAGPTSSRTGMRPAFLFLPASFRHLFFQNNAETVRYDQKVVPPVLSFNIHLSRYPFFEETDQEKTYPITRNTGDTDNEQTKQRGLN